MEHETSSSDSLDPQPIRISVTADIHHEPSTSLTRSFDEFNNAFSSTKYNISDIGELPSAAEPVNIKKMLFTKPLNAAEQKRLILERQLLECQKEAKTLLQSSAYRTISPQKEPTLELEPIQPIVELPRSTVTKRVKEPQQNAERPKLKFDNLRTYMKEFVKDYPYKKTRRIGPQTRDERITEALLECTKIQREIRDFLKDV